MSERREDASEEEPNPLEAGETPQPEGTEVGSDQSDRAETDETAEPAATATAAATAAMAAEADERAAAAAIAAEADVERDRGLRPSERRALRAAERSQIPIDPSLRIKDRASSAFVILTLVVFSLLLLNGLVFGRGGFLTSSPSPTVAPVPTLAPGASPTAAPSGSPAAATAAPTVAPTVAPTGAPTTEPAATPAAS